LGGHVFGEIFLAECSVKVIIPSIDDIAARRGVTGQLVRIIQAAGFLQGFPITGAS
jgi:hypothetical protein